MRHRTRKALANTLLALGIGCSAVPPALAKSHKQHSPQAPGCYAEYVADAKTGKVLHAKNADAPVLPASVAKMVLGLVLNDAIAEGKTGWDQMIEVPKPPPYDPKDPKASSIHATVCNVDDIGKNGTVPTSVREALSNTSVASNLYTTIGLQRHLEHITGETYANLAARKLKQIGAAQTTIVEPTGLSNAAKCLNENRDSARYAQALQRKDGSEKQTSKQNISTAHDMSRWARASMAIPEMVRALRQRVVRFMDNSFINTNPLIRTAHAAPASPAKNKKTASPGPTPRDVDFIAKTGFTITSGLSINGILNPDHERPLVITLATCPSREVRDRRLHDLINQFGKVTGKPSSFLDNPVKIADSRPEPNPLQVAGPAWALE